MVCLALQAAVGSADPGGVPGRPAAAVRWREVEPACPARPGAARWAWLAGLERPGRALAAGGRAVRPVPDGPGRRADGRQAELAVCPGRSVPDGPRDDQPTVGRSVAVRFVQMVEVQQGGPAAERVVVRSAAHLTDGLRLRAGEAEPTGVRLRAEMRAAAVKLDAPPPAGLAAADLPAAPQRGAEAPMGAEGRDGLRPAVEALLAVARRPGAVRVVWLRRGAALAVWPRPEGGRAACRREASVRPVAEPAAPTAGPALALAPAAAEEIRPPRPIPAAGVRTGVSCPRSPPRHLSLEKCPRGAAVEVRACVCSG